MINSNIGSISYRFRDMASFPLKTRIFPTFLRFNSIFENVCLALHPPNFVRRQPRHKTIANYSCKKFSFKTYPLARVHP